MAFVQNFPFFCIILSMFSAILSFVMSEKAAKYIHITMVLIVLVLSLGTLSYVVGTGESYTFMMGHFPAPWGNEICIGVLEALMAASFSAIMLLSVFGGLAHVEREVQNSRKSLLYIMLDLLMASLLALIYTNDLFTAYVFIEINTIAACGLIIVKKQGRTYVSAIRYMVMSLVGSGLFLIGLTLLYGTTDHLLMSPTKEALDDIFVVGVYHIPFVVIMALIVIGLGIKSGMYLFHTWIPDAYGYTTPTCSAILSSLVSKGYIFLMIKIFFRVIGYDSIISRYLVNILFVLGLIGMIMGSIAAIKENDIRRMTAFSSVAQIGYIYMGIGLGTTAGVVAALFHVVAHGIMKSQLFISISGLIDVSDGKQDLHSLKGAGYRSKIAGVAYTTASMSMIGIPLFCGFVSKYLFASSAMTASSGKLIAAWIVLGISTILNTVYFMRMVIAIYMPVDAEMRKAHGIAPSRIEAAAMAGMILFNIAVGVMSPPIVKALESGIAMFG